VESPRAWLGVSRRIYSCHRGDQPYYLYRGVGVADGFQQTVMHGLEDSGMPPEYLDLEIRESISNFYTGFVTVLTYTDVILV